jgi:hypothetical protein
LEKEASGKTAKAIEMAESIGTYVITNYDSLLSNFQLAPLLDKKPGVVIVEESSLKVLEEEIIKALITNNGIKIEHRYKDAGLVILPRNWIFIHTLKSRRFEIIVI